MTSRMFGLLAAGAGVVAVALVGANPSADTSLAIQPSPACFPWEWNCGPGGFSTPADDGIPGDNAAEGGIPAPAVVPNVDGSLSPPGMPGDEKTSIQPLAGCGCQCASPAPGGTRM